MRMNTVFWVKCIMLGLLPFFSVVFVVNSSQTIQKFYLDHILLYASFIMTFLSGVQWGTILSCNKKYLLYL